MPLTPETLARHELAGLRVAVVDAPNPDLVGIAGRVVRETTNTLVIEGPVPPEAPRERGGGAAEHGDASREWQVPKSGTTFEFALADEAAATREGAGTASERPSETACVEAGGSGGLAGTGPAASRVPPGDCEDVAYVTVEGARLLSRPARRTETGGAPTWR